MLQGLPLPVPSMMLLVPPHCAMKPPLSSPSLNPNSPFIPTRNPRSTTLCKHPSLLYSGHPNRTETLKLPTRELILQLVAPGIFFVGFWAGACRASAFNLTARRPLEPAVSCELLSEENSGDAIKDNVDVNDAVDDDLKAAFENWKSKTYALTVPLRIVALRGSMPPSWVKDFIQVQGKRLKLRSEFRGSLETIFSELALASDKHNVKPGSAMAADIVTIGDSWLDLAISRSLIEPIQGAEGQDWFSSLSEKWKVHLCRNGKGELDSDGKIWGAPYRWGSMVIAYKKNKFKEHNIASIEDWADLWRPELAGKVSMVDAPREVLGAVLKYMGASYNTKDIESQVNGGRNAVLQNLAALQRQVRLFDSVHYLKAFGAGDVWVAVGWSSDVLPAAKRMSNVAVIVPKSGTSLWADLWVVPAASRFITDQIGGRVRSPSPLIHQWMEFSLQIARSLPFQQEVIPGASPLALQGSGTPFPEGSDQLFTKGRPKLDTNLIAGKPPPEILNRCEFLEPLSSKAFADYQWLTDRMQQPGGGWINGILNYLLFQIRSFGFYRRSM